MFYPVIFYFLFRLIGPLLTNGHSSGSEFRDSKYGPLTNGQNIEIKVCVEKSGLNLGHGWAADGP
ncbi:MAG: hypothetical protein CTY12_07670 [Methylotenera sp.]|nr:MAG: hypothetical protein CTY12_07670 [Methylotenera sp.]